MTTYRTRLRDGLSYATKDADSLAARREERLRRAGQDERDITVYATEDRRERVKGANTGAEIAG